MKFQDDISNLHTYIHTYTHTRNKPKPICSPLFQSWGHNYKKWIPTSRLFFGPPSWKERSGSKKYDPVNDQDNED